MLQRGPVPIRNWNVPALDGAANPSGTRTDKRLSDPRRIAFDHVLIMIFPGPGFGESPFKMFGRKAIF